MTRTRSSPPPSPGSTRSTPRTPSTSTTCSRDCGCSTSTAGSTASSWFALASSGPRASRTAVPAPMMATPIQTSVAAPTPIGTTRPGFFEPVASVRASPSFSTSPWRTQLASTRVWSSVAPAPKPTTVRASRLPSSMSRNSPLRSSTSPVCGGGPSGSVAPRPSRRRGPAPRRRRRRARRVGVAACSGLLESASDDRHGCDGSRRRDQRTGGRGEFGPAPRPASPRRTLPRPTTRERRGSGVTLAPRAIRSVLVAAAASAAQGSTSGSKSGHWRGSATKTAASGSAASSALTRASRQEPKFRTRVRAVGEVVQAHALVLVDEVALHPAAASKVSRAPERLEPRGSEERGHPPSSLL